MKKTISILLAFVLVLTLQLPVFAAGTPTVTATADKTSVSAGETVTFTISLDTVIEKVSSFEFYLYYDTEAFEFKESTIGNVYSASVVSRPKTDKDGKPYVGVSGINPTSEDITMNVGTICTMTFTALKEANATFTLTNEGVYENRWDIAEPLIDVALSGEETVVTVAPVASTPFTSVSLADGTALTPVKDGKYEYYGRISDLYIVDVPAGTEYVTVVMPESQEWHIGYVGVDGSFGGNGYSDGNTNTFKILVDNQSNGIQDVGTVFIKGQDKPYFSLKFNVAEAPKAAVTLELEHDTYSAGDKVTAKVYLECDGEPNVFGYGLTYNQDTMAFLSSVAGDSISVSSSEIDKNTGSVVREFYVTPGSALTGDEDGRVLIDTLTFVMTADGNAEMNFMPVEDATDEPNEGAYAITGGEELETDVKVVYLATAAEDMAAASKADELIEAIGEPVYEYGAEIEAAREIYEALTEEQKGYVTKLEKLETAEKTYNFWLLGDVNLNGVINANDLSLLLSAYGTENASCDINGSGAVDAADLSVLLANYRTKIA